MRIDALAECVEIRLVQRCSQRRLRAVEQQSTESLYVLILANQIADLFAAGAVPTLGNLRIDESFQRFGQRNVHGAHARQTSRLGKKWQTLRIEIFQPGSGNLNRNVLPNPASLAISTVPPSPISSSPRSTGRVRLPR